MSCSVYMDMPRVIYYACVRVGARSLRKGANKMAAGHGQSLHWQWCVIEAQVLSAS